MIFKAQLCFPVNHCDYFQEGTVADDIIEQGNTLLLRLRARNVYIVLVIKGSRSNLCLEKK